MHDSPGDAERSTQQLLGQCQVSISQYLSQPCTADALAANLDGRRGLDRESFRGACVEQKVEVTSSVTTKAEVVPHFKMANPKPFDQRRMNELGSTQFTQAAIEGQAKHEVDALLVQQPELFTQTGQPGRRLVWRKILTRLRLEYHHAAWQIEFSRTLAQSRQDCLVPSMNSVEIADGGNAPPMPGPQVVKTSNQLHTALLD